MAEPDACRACGTPLPYPTLCRACLYAPEKIVCTYRDGAIFVDTPPVRNLQPEPYRSGFLGYLDCPACAGHGYTMERHPQFWGGRYRRYCNPCLVRFNQSNKEEEDDAVVQG